MRNEWRRWLWRSAGSLAVAAGTIGLALPIVPTVPFYILAAWCFGKSSPALEARLLTHPRFGPHIRAWRERRAIARPGKIAATVGLAISGAGGLILLDPPEAYAPLGVAVLASAFILTRPD